MRRAKSPDRYPPLRARTHTNSAEFINLTHTHGVHGRLGVVGTRGCVVTFYVHSVPGGTALPVKKTARAPRCLYVSGNSRKGVFGQMEHNVQIYAPTG